MRPNNLGQSDDDDDGFGPSFSSSHRPQPPKDNSPSATHKTKVEVS